MRIADDYSDDSISLIHEDRDPRQAAIAMLRYAVHTLSFDESSPLQKHWALYTACRAAEKVSSALAIDKK